VRESRRKADHIAPITRQILMPAPETQAGENEEARQLFTAARYYSTRRTAEGLRQAIERLERAVELDPEYSIWSSFNNHYWPALYFVDAQGNIRHHQFGEGKYDESEKIIQQLLKESGAVDIDDQTVSVDARGEEAPADWDDLGSPENYVGFDRTENFASHGGTVLDAARVYEFPSTLELNQWALSGEWTFERETLAMRKFGGKLSYRFHARDLHIVMGPGKSESPIRFRILIDGKPPGDAHGIDVDADGNGTIVEPRMYQLIRQPKPISDRVLEIEFLDPGAELFSFTFG